MRGPGADRLLERALIESAVAAGATLAIDGSRTRPWSSATFSGTRHALDVSTPSADRCEQWLDRLPDADLPIRGHLLAGLTVLRRDRSAGRLRVRIEATTVVEQ